MVSLRWNVDMCGVWDDGIQARVGILGYWSEIFIFSREDPSFFFFLISSDAYDAVIELFQLQWRFRVAKISHVLKSSYLKNHHHHYSSLGRFARQGQKKPARASSSGNPRRRAQT